MKFDGNNFKEVIAEHATWLDWMDAHSLFPWQNCDIVYKNAINPFSKADFTGANLIGVNFKNYDLRGAIFCNCDLTRANFVAADLTCACFDFANLSYANFERANLKASSLRQANLSYADFACADLTGAYLVDANLHKAKIVNALLIGTRSIGLVKNSPYIPMACPDTGEFIGWKKALAGNRNDCASEECIVKLLIPESAKRSSGTERKCRCDKAYVLEVQTLDGTPMDASNIIVHSFYDFSFHYKVGETVSPDEKEAFDTDRWLTCGSGIHFFINRQEAVEYSYP